MTSQKAKIEDAIFFLISLLFAFQGDGLEIGIQSMRLPRSRLPARRRTSAGEPSPGGQVARNDRGVEKNVDPLTAF